MIVRGEKELNQNPATSSLAVDIMRLLRETIGTVQKRRTYWRSTEEENILAQHRHERRRSIVRKAVRSRQVRVTGLEMLSEV